MPTTEQSPSDAAKQGILLARAFAGMVRRARLDLAARRNEMARRRTQYRTPKRSALEGDYARYARSVDAAIGKPLR
jgi:hypothetical protein